MPNFFQLYADYVKVTEPPPNFHAWSAIGAISALLGKKVHIPQGHFTVFPNLYIILVGEAGTRKSTAMNIAKRLVRLVKEVPFAPDSGSREALIDTMAASKVLASFNGKDCSYWQCASFGTELEQFLGGKHVNQAMVGFLTAIWDEMIFKERTRKGGEVIVHNPYFSMLGCCTPTWVTDKLRQDVITDGFSRRVIFALEKEPNCLNAWPESTAEQLQTLATLYNEAQRIFQIAGPYEMSKQAREYYAKQYVKMREDAKKYSEKIQSYFTSKHELALKLAMCISAGIDSTRFITLAMIELAFTFLAQSERCLELVFSGIGRNELNALSERALNRVRERGEKGMTKAEFVSACYADMNAAEISEVWDVLNQKGQTVPFTGSAQDVPRCRATILNPLAPGVNLMKSASLVERHPEEKVATTGAFELANHLAPETETFLADLKARRLQTSNGVLLKGKSSLSPDELLHLSRKPVV